jgi:hypothetical protein
LRGDSTPEIQIQHLGPLPSHLSDLDSQMGQPHAKAMIFTDSVFILPNAVPHFGAGEPL